MKIGIVSRCIREKGKLLNFFKNRGIKEYYIKGFEIKQVILSGKITDKKIKKAVRKLERSEVSFILTENVFKGKEETKNLCISEKICILNCFFELYKEYAKSLELKAYKMNILIIDKDLAGVDFDFIKRLCFYVSKCDVLTDEKANAKEIGDRIFKQSGFFMGIVEKALGSYDAVFDIDNKILKVAGRVFINKIDFGLEEFLKFDINIFEIIKKLKDYKAEIQYRKTEGNKAYFEIKN